MVIYKNILQAKTEGRKLPAVLIDPDNSTDRVFEPVSSKMIQAAVEAPAACGDMVVVGNAVEKDPSQIFDMSAAIYSIKSKIS